MHASSPSLKKNKTVSFSSRLKSYGTLAKPRKLRNTHSFQNCHKNIDLVIVKAFSLLPFFAFSFLFCFHSVFFKRDPEIKTRIMPIHSSFLFFFFFIPRRATAGKMEVVNRLPFTFQGKMLRRFLCTHIFSLYINSSIHINILQSLSHSHIFSVYIQGVSKTVYTHFYTVWLKSAFFLFRFTRSYY